MACRTMPLHGGTFASDCGERDKLIVSRDRGSPRKHIADNANGKSVFHIQLDGKVFPGDACDFLLLCDSAEHIAYFIELKGKDSKKALDQLGKTADKLKEDLKNYAFRFRAVTSGTPHAMDNQSEKDKLWRKWASARPLKEFLVIKTGRLKEHI